ncbi:hypothetical protein B0T19DRAFT_403738 [Cercophora scortea]|uniref:AT hook domain-containing protein n=1 Tax=Cercophora scortea TaxID=314031 RepID=A0AAE0M6E6_9PEZI|nr:hypothetical protein B0T19DRAFT_403738 [Cercophora scortea]
MASRREILDSGDEDSELSSVNGDWDMEGDADGVAQDAPQDATTAARSTGSTDPSFFQRVYEEQEAAAAANLVASAVQSSPTADQPPESRSARRSTRGGRNNDVVDLTQINTPGRKRAAPEDDLWDVPGSSLPALAGRSQAKAQKTYGKRKRAGVQASPEDDGTQPHSASPNRSVHDPYDVPDDSDAPPNKKAKRGRKPASTRQARDVSPMGIPQTGESSGSARRPRRGRGDASGASNESTIPDTLPSLYLAPSALTASQKEEFKVVRLSSEPGHDGLESSMPPTQAQVTGMYKSSGATTIAYPTPTQFASSGPRELPSVEMSENVSAAVDEMSMEEHQQSSPDVISAVSSSAKRRKIKIVNRRGFPSSEREPPVLHQVVEEAAFEYGVDGGDPQDDVQFKGDDAEPLQALPAEPEPLADDAIEMSTMAPQEPAPKKKRGRKKKEVVIIQNDVAEDDQAEVSNPTEEFLQPSAALMEVDQPPKRGRGRPRKSDTPAIAAAQAEETVGDTLATESPGPAAVTGGKKRGRKKKAVPAVVEDSDAEEEAVKEEVDGDHDDDEEEEDVKRRPLSKTSRNSQPPPTDTVSIKRDDDAKENQQEQKAVKAVATPAKPSPGSLAGQTSSGKVQYRVGLSKRSRIAPLLKIMRK